MLAATEIDTLVGRIVALTRPEKVIIFGSYAKGMATIRSDLDIFLIKETVLPMANRVDDLKPMLSCVLISVEVHNYTPEELDEYCKEEFSFVSSVLRSGKTVYEKAEASGLIRFDGG